MRPTEKKIENLLQNLNDQTRPELDRKILDGCFTELNTQKSSMPKVRQNIWSILMKKPITKYATAAIVILAALTGIYQITGSIDGASVAWADVADKVVQARSFMFRHRVFMSDSENETESNPVMDMTLYLSQEYGFRMDILADNTVVSWYVHPEAKTMTMVIPHEKKWLKMPYSEEKFRQLPEKDPRDYIKRFMACEYLEQGHQIIDGHETEYIEVRNPPMDDEKLENAVGRLWVDLKTNLPVRLEIEGTANSKIVQWLMDFQWEEDFEASLFEPDISDDYDLIQ